jgi:hypothetical protein
VTEKESREGSKKGLKLKGIQEPAHKRQYVFYDSLYTRNDLDSRYVEVESIT